MEGRVKRLRAQAKVLEPVGFIGRDELTPGVIEELRRQLKAKKLIKIKINKSFYEGHEKKERAQFVADQLNAELIDKVGFVIVIAKKGYGGIRDKNR